MFVFVMIFSISACLLKTVLITDWREMLVFKNSRMMKTLGAFEKIGKPNDEGIACMHVFT